MSDDYTNRREGADEAPTPGSPPADDNESYLLEYTSLEEIVEQEESDDDRSEKQRTFASRVGASASHEYSHEGTQTEEIVEAFDMSTQAGGSFQGQSRIPATFSSANEGVAEIEVHGATVFDSVARMPISNQSPSPNTTSIFPESFFFPVDNTLLYSDDGVSPIIYQQLAPNASTPIGFQPPFYPPIAFSAVAPLPTKGSEEEDSSLDRKPAAMFQPERQFARGDSNVDDHHIGPDRDERENVKTDRDSQSLRSWYQRLQELIEFRHRYGHTRVPQKYPINPKLGVWVNKMRREKKLYDEGDPKSSMTPIRIAKLDAAGFVWAKAKGIDAWEQRFAELIEYVEEKGDPHVPTKHNENRALGRWVSEQRTMYRRYKAGARYHKLTNEETERRISLLESMGFSWNMAATSGPDHAKKDESQEGDSHEDRAV